MKDYTERCHDLKIKKDYADSIWFGGKNFEVRYNDRNYQKGDFIIFFVVDNDGNHLDGHILDGKYYMITNVHSGLGMQDGYVVLGIKYPELEE